MANPDRWFDDDNNKDDFSWLPILLVGLGIIYIVILLFFGASTQETANTCNTYYQGDELVSDCE